MTERGVGYVLVEGHGEVEAVGNLLARVSEGRDLPFRWARPIRWQDTHSRDGLAKGAEFIRRKADASALLVLRDEDDGCPKELAPEIASWLIELQLPFPTAVVLLHPEYEVLFLPCIELMAGRELGGRPGLVAGARWDAESWEARRGVKEWLTKHFPPNRSYKPTTDQLLLTRLIDLVVLRRAGVPCFGSLERSLEFLRDHQAKGAAYPRRP